MIPVPLLLACASEVAEGPDDARFYVTLLSARDMPTTERIEACRQLSDPDLAGDCALAAVEASPSHDRRRVEDWCSRVPTGPWRDECLFQLAQHALQHRDLAWAARLCGEAGRFANDCGRHLWWADLERIDLPDGPETFRDHLAQAQSLYDVWAPLLGETTDLEARFWGRFYQVGFEPALRVLPRACTALEEPHRSRCDSSAVGSWRARLENALSEPEARTWFCARTASAATVSAVLMARTDVPPLPGRLDTEPTPSLDAEVAALRATRCRSP